MDHVWNINSKEQEIFAKYAFAKLGLREIRLKIKVKSKWKWKCENAGELDLYICHKTNNIIYGESN